MPTPRKHANAAARAAAYRQRQKEARLAELAAKGLPALPPVPTMPGAARWSALRNRMRSDGETLRDEMQAYLDERSKSWQESDKGAAFQDRVDATERVLDAIAEMES